MLLREKYFALVKTVRGRAPRSRSLTIRRKRPATSQRPRRSQRRRPTAADASRSRVTPAMRARIGRRLSGRHVRRPSRRSRRKHIPKCRRSQGVRIATAEAGIKYKNRTDLLLMVFDDRHRGGRRLHPLEMPVGAGRFLPRRNLAARQGARAGRQFRQRQCLHRQEGPRSRPS